MSKFMDRARELRTNPELHYNCYQAVVAPFAEDLDYNPQQVYDMGRALGGGMRAGSTCGAIAGGLSVLGMYKKDDPATVAEYYRRLRDNHQGHTNCADLLRINKEQGGEKKEHCDGMVYECVKLAEELIK